MMNKPALHHFLDHFSSKVRNKELAEGLAAAAALLAVGRGGTGAIGTKNTSKRGFATQTFSGILIWITASIGMMNTLVIFWKTVRQVKNVS